MTDAAVKSILEERWGRALDAGHGMFNLVSAEHPLRLYIGGNQVGKPTLSLVLQSRPPSISKFSSLDIEHRKREDGSWVLLLQLQSISAFREFVALCSELISSSANEQSEEGGLSAFLDCLDRWRNLFRPVRDAILSEEQLRGLAAELTAMIELFYPARSWPEIIQGWEGPFRAAQDFHLSGGVSVEVKSVHAGSKSVRISSLEQLTCTGKQLYLSTVVVERDVEEADGVVTVPGLCRSVEKLLGHQFGLVDEFRDRLRETGFDPAEPLYSEFFYRIGAPLLFEVAPGFPRLDPQLVPDGVLSVEYDISLVGIAPFASPTEEVFPAEVLGGRPKWN